MADRRHVLGMLLTGALVAAGHSRPALAQAPEAARNALRIAITPALLHDKNAALERWRDYLTRALGRPVEFVLRDSYRETIDLFRLGQIDFGWICDYPYLYLRRHVSLCAVPHFRGEPAYRAYLIVAANDARTRSIADLRGKLFAFADPYSNTGYLVPRFELHRIGERPDGFFAKHFFTHGHRRIVEAVAAGLADGGSVDSYIYETLAEQEPQLVARTRIAWRSQLFGFPPLVAHRARVDPALFNALQQVLLSMADDPEGRSVLKAFSLDRFAVEPASRYDGVAAMMKTLGEYDFPA